MRGGVWRERGCFSPQKEQTGRKKQKKSNRALGPQNDSKEKIRPAMERERSCCRRENVIKYPGSWANAPLLRDWETDLSRFCRRGSEQSLQIQPGGGTPQGGFSRPLSDSPSTESPSSAPVCALGHLPPGRGKAGRAARCAAPTAPFEPFGTGGSGTCAEGGDLPPHPPRIRSAPSPQGEGFRATARVAPTAYPAPVPLVR